MLRIYEEESRISGLQAGEVSLLPPAQPDSLVSLHLLPRERSRSLNVQSAARNVSQNVVLVPLVYWDSAVVLPNCRLTSTYENSRQKLKRYSVA
jgi:hypothetical protein